MSVAEVTIQHLEIEGDEDSSVPWVGVSGRVVAVLRAEQVRISPEKWYVTVLVVR